MIPNTSSFFSFTGWHPVIYLFCVSPSPPWFRSALPSCHIVFPARVFTSLSTFAPFLPPLILTFLSPIWLMFCLHLFRCSQQQWPSSRLVRPRCQVSFFILPAVHSILQLSSLRSRGGKSAARRRKREREEEKGRGRRKGETKLLCTLSAIEVDLIPGTLTTQDN